MPIINLPIEEYRALPEPSCSMVARACDPNTTWATLFAPTEPTPSMKLGTVTHGYILEGIMPRVWELDGRTKAGKEEREAFPDAVKPEERDAIIRMDENIHLTPHRIPHLDGLTIGEVILKMRERGTVEVQATASLDGRAFRGMADGVYTDSEGNAHIIELKTSSDASHRHFSRDAMKRFYHVQAWGYMALFGAVTHTTVVVSKSDPLGAGCAIYTMPKQALQEAEALFRQSLEAVYVMRDYEGYKGYPEPCELSYYPSI